MEDGAPEPSSRSSSVNPCPLALHSFTFNTMEFVVTTAKKAPFYVTFDGYLGSDYIVEDLLNFAINYILYTLYPEVNTTFIPGSEREKFANLIYMVSEENG